MDIFVFLSRFIFRIRYKLITGAILSIILSYYFTDFLPKMYDVSTTIFTGITSKASIDATTTKTDWNSANNAHDNIINLIKSKSTMEMVSIKLIAQHLMYGSAEQDTKYISAKHYRQLLKFVPQNVLPLIDKNSFDNTVKNLIEYRKEDKNNFVYAIFSWSYQHYSYMALSTIKIARKGASDMIEISYKCNDPGVATNTIAFLNEELTLRHETLLLSASNSVVAHFELQLKIAAQKLSDAEDRLVQFNIDNKIINYEEQTKHLSALNNSLESRYEEILLTNRSSMALINELENQMITRTKLMRENEVFLNALSDISTLNGQIVELEIFGKDSTSSGLLQKNKDQLLETEKKLKGITDKIDTYKYTKEGVGIDNMVNEWLDALLKYEKSTAELEVMSKRKDEINKQYAFYSPVGPNLGRQDREVRVSEEAYITILNHLGQAKLKQKNILLDAGTLQIVTPPEFPLLATSRKREIYMIAALLATLIFIMGFYLLIEMMDHTIRDGQRAERLTGGKVIGALPSCKRLKYRRFNEEIRRICITHLANILNKYLKVGEPMIVNIISIEPGEGKSFIADKLKQYWEDRGFAVKSISHHSEIDFDSKQFKQLTSIYDIPGTTHDVDIIIVEYAPLKYSNIPDDLLKESSKNLLILNAERIWVHSDGVLFENLENSAGGKNLVSIFLNNTDNEATEQYTGQLPPYTFIRRMSHRLFNFGITSKS